MAYDSTKKPSAAELEEVHARAMKRADEAWVFERENVDNGREDQRFYVGGLNQWDDAARKARGTSRPMLTVNRMPGFVRQLTGDIRRETPAIKVNPAKGGATKRKADIYSGMIRSIEAKTDADAAYSKAAENAAKAGQGAFRVHTKYVSDTSFEQEIVIEQIADPFAVLIDPFARQPDKADMAYGYVFERMSVEAFEAKYPGKKADDIPMGGDNTGFTWRTGDSVRIAEYWERKPGPKKTLYLLEGNIAVEKVPRGRKVVREREVQSETICSYMVSGKDILSGPHEWPGKYIPICLVVGEEDTIDGATVRKGMIRDAKDPQKLLNYARTTQAEVTALQPKAPYQLTVKMIEGYEDQWGQIGSSLRPYVVYNPDPIVPTGPKREQPPLMAPALIDLSTTASQDIKDVTGIFDASLGARSNETSGRAILARQHEGDTGTFLYRDSLRRAISYCGRILVDLIPKVYDSPRLVRTLKEDGSHEMVDINVPDDPETDLSLGEYDVVVSTGPSFLTAREEKREALVGLVQAVPAIGEAAADQIVDALDFPGGEEIVKRLRAKMGLSEDGKPLPQQQPQPDPALVAKAMADAAKADLTKAQAEGQEIENVTALAQLLPMLSGLPQMMQQMQATLQQVLALNDNGGGGAPPTQPGGAPPMPPQGGPPMMNGEIGQMSDMPPTIELDEGEPF